MYKSKTKKETQGGDSCKRRRSHKSVTSSTWNKSIKSKQIVKLGPSGTY